MPTGTAWLVTSVELPGPVTVVGPLTAVSVQLAGTGVAPVPLASTALTKVSRGWTAVLVMVQVTLSPRPRVTVAAVVVGAAGADPVARRCSRAARSVSDRS